MPPLHCKIGVHNSTVYMPTHNHSLPTDSLKGALAEANLGATTVGP